MIWAKKNKASRNEQSRECYGRAQNSRTHNDSQQWTTITLFTYYSFIQPLSITLMTDCSFFFRQQSSAKEISHVKNKRGSRKTDGRSQT